MAFLYSSKYKTAKNILFLFFIGITVFLSNLRIYMECYLGWDFNLVSNVDDEMQVNNAGAILDGLWMGNYSNVAIPKHPMFPIYLAFIHIIHMPYPISVGLLICASSLLFIIAIRPLVNNKVIRGLFYLFLIFNPVGFAENFASRIYRNSLIPWAVLLFVSCMIGLYLRKEEATRKMVFWSIASGISVSFFWYLREDSIWMMPFLLAVTTLIVLYFIVFFFKVYKKGERKEALKKSSKRIIQYAVILLIPICMLGLTRLGIMGLNKINYGISVAEDRVESKIGDVMKNLYHIDDGHNWKEERPEGSNVILISSESIKLAQEASPTLARLDNLLSCYYKLSGGEELWADWPEWALRDAAAEKGYYRDAVDTEVFFAIVAG